MCFRKDDVGMVAAFWGGETRLSEELASKSKECYWEEGICGGYERMAKFDKKRILRIRLSLLTTMVFDIGWRRSDGQLDDASVEVEEGGASLTVVLRTVLGP
jgi:hypothetical protein